IHPAVGSEIAAILTKAMAQDPERRYRSAAEFREALRQIGRQAPNRKRYQPYPAGSVLFSEVAGELEMFKTLPASARPERRPALIGLVVLLLISAAGGVFYSYQRSQPSTPAPVKEKSVIPTKTRQTEKVPSSNAETW